MSIKISFGATNLYKGLLNQGIDGIGYYCQELLGRLEKSEVLQITPYSFGYIAKNFPGHLLSKYPTYLLKSIADRAIPLFKIDDASPSFFNQFDLIHATDQLVPINIDRPLIATVMDIIPITHPHLIPSKLARIKALAWKKLTLSANHIITTSEFSKQQIIKFMHYPAEQISVAPLGVDDRYFDEVSEEDINTTLRKFSLPEKFFLHIGTIQPRKNIIKTLEAHSKLPLDFSQQYPLVLAGKYGWGDRSHYKMINQAIKEHRCIWINYISDLEKRALLQKAIALTFISLYEGFGLPIIEAFASKTPVITSANSSMIEVSGDAATLVDPNSLDEIRNALLAAIQNHNCPSDRIQLGIARAKQYSWDAAAFKTQQIYLRVMKENHLSLDKF